MNILRYGKPRELELDDAAVNTAWFIPPELSHFVSPLGFYSMGCLTKEQHSCVGN